MPIGSSTREMLLIMRAKDQASRVIRDVSSAFRQSGMDMDEAGKKAQDAAKRQMNTGAAMMGVGAAAIGMGAVVAGAFGSMAKSAADYEKQVAGTFTQVTEFETSMEELGAIGKRVGSEIGIPFKELQPALKTIFSSIDVSLAQSEILLETFAKGAVAGVTDVETSAKSAIAIMNSFKLETADLGHIMDVQFKTTQLGVITYEEYARTIGRATSSTEKAGGTIEDLSGIMAFLTRNGLSAAMAATSAGRAFDLLSNPKFESNMNKLGLTVFDASGNFKPMVKVTDELRKKLEHLNEEDRAAAIKELTLGAGGTIQAMRFMNAAVMDTTGQLGEFTDAMYNSDGAMETAYQKMEKTYAVQLQKLQNNWEILRIELGSKVLPIMNGVIDALSATVKAFTDLPEPIKTGIVVVGVLVAGLLILSGTITLVAGAISFITGAFALMGGAAALTSGALGTLAIRALYAKDAIALFIIQLRLMSAASAMALGAIGVVIAALGFVAFNSVRAYNDYKNFSKEVQKELKVTNLDSLRQAIKKTEDELKAITKSQDKWYNSVNIGGAMAMDKAGKDLEELRTQLSQTNYVINEAALATGLNTEEVQKLADKYGINLNRGLEKATEHLVENIHSVRDASPAAQELANANTELATAVDHTTESMEAFKEALDAAVGVEFDLDKAHIALAEGADKLREAHDASRGSTDLSTEAGRKLLDMLVKQSEQIIETTLAEANAGEISALSASQKQKIIDRLVEMQKQYPALREHIQRYIDKVNEVQTEVVTKVDADVEPAMSKISRLKGEISALFNSKPAVATENWVKGITDKLNPNMKRATGGMIPAHAGMVLVGETGPELLNLGSGSGYVTGAVKTKNLMSSPTGGSNFSISSGAIQIVIQGDAHNGIEDKIADRVADILDDLVSDMRAG